MALPHITNSAAGVNKYDIVTKNIFEVYFTLPQGLEGTFSKDVPLLTQHVTKISGLDALDKAPTTVVQKFMGTDRSYIQPKLDSTRAEITVEFTLNLRDKTDNYIYKVFKAWKNLGYNIATGERNLKADYTAEFLKILVGNPAGDVYREIVFKDVMIADSIGGMGEYDYESADPVAIEVKFVSDWWDEINA